MNACDKKEIISRIYNNQELRFPLIAAIIENIQAGEIMQNNELTHFFIINKFGFCQEFFSEFDEKFAGDIKNFILNRKYKKLRLYAPNIEFENFLSRLESAQKSERIQFEFDKTLNLAQVDNNFRIEKANLNNIKSFDFGLDLFNRYWNSLEDFLINAHAILAFDGDIPAGICYSAGNGLNKAEVDVFVEEKHRKIGLGYILGKKFIEECLKNNLTPGWDCYSNNQGSVNLARKLGFRDNISYNFYNIDGV